MESIKTTLLSRGALQGKPSVLFNSIEQTHNRVNSKHMSGAAGLASTQRWDINGAKIMGLLYDNELQSGEDRGSLYTEQLYW